MMREWFDAQMRRMLSLKFPPEDLKEHFKALADLPDDVLALAVSHALKTRAYFPTIAELRADADAATKPAASPEPERPKVVDLEDARIVEVPNPLGGDSLTLTVTKDWYFDCDVCEDSGWAHRWCGERPSAPWLVKKRCERQKPHSAHEWVERCVCIATNPTILRRQAATAKYSKAPEKVA